MKNILFHSTALLAAVTSILFSSDLAQAQSTQRGTDAAYIGAGVSANVTNGGQNGDAANLGGNIQGRYQIENTPVSVRGAILFGKETTAIMPMVSYDLGIANNTNLYLGAGYSFVESEGQPSPLGNRNAAVVTIGAESAIGENFMVYTDGKWGIDAYQDSKADALSFQAGVGYRF